MGKKRQRVREFELKIHLYKYSEFRRKADTSILHADVKTNNKSQKQKI